MSDSITVMSRTDVVRRWPRITAHLICESLGYCTPTSAAGILKAAKKGESCFAEWILCCYGGRASAALRDAIRNRRSHRGFMADYAAARLLVESLIHGGREPEFSSW